MITEEPDLIPTPPPQDLVAIFHASFHPTKGNTIDWCLKSSDDLNVDSLEFSSLPSGLHLVDQDVVYFTNQSHHGLCLFRRRRTSNPIHRGFRLSSLGILLAPSSRPRPWRHLPALRDVADRVYSSMASEDDQVLISTDGQWEPAQEFFEERKVRRSDLSGAGDWRGWSEELDGIHSAPSTSIPTLHLPHLLKILGPSSLTLYKHILSRRRVLIYTQPPVEASCILCYVAADMAWEIQCQSQIAPKLKRKNSEGVKVLGMVTLNDLMGDKLQNTDGRGWVACTTDALFLEKPQHYDLLIDLTTFTSGETTAGYRPRPSFYLSKPVSSSKPTQHRLSSIRFAWSDVRLWSELDRILKLRSSNHLHRDPSLAAMCNCYPSTSSSTTQNSGNTMNNMSGPMKPSKHSQIITAWTDAWQVYEDVCLLCAGIWMGSWKRRSEEPSNESENWGLRKTLVRSASSGGEVRLDGEDDILLGGLPKESFAGGSTTNERMYVRNLGMGIEGVPLGPSTSSSSAGTTSTLGVGTSSTLGSGSKTARRISAMSWGSGRTTVTGNTISALGKAKQAPSPPNSSGLGVEEEVRETGQIDQDVAIDVDTSDVERQIENERRESEVRTTFCLLQTLYAYAVFQMGVLEAFLPDPSTSSLPSQQDQKQQQDPPAPIAATGVSTGGSTGGATTPTKRMSGSRSPTPVLTPAAESSSSTDTSLPLSSLGKITSPDLVTVTLTPKDLLLFDLNPLSSFDARYLEWLGSNYAVVEGDNASEGGEQQLRVVVKRGWKELVGALVGW